MRKALLLTPLLLSLLTVTCYGQRTGDLGFASGIVNYVGDLANEKYFPLSSAAPGLQVTFRNFLNDPDKSSTLYKPLSLELRFSWHRLQYDETSPVGGKSGMELRNYLRGLGFRNDLFGTMVNFTYTFYPNRFRPLYKQKFACFLLAGAGVFYGAPKADLFHGSIDLKNRYYFWNNGTIHDVAEGSGAQGHVIQKDGVYETNLRDWHTEGEESNAEGKNKPPYSLVNAGFPLGFGVRYGYSRNITFSAEFDYYFFLTDYLDDVSDRYATYNELATSFPDPTKFEIAKYISDPTGKGTTGVISPQTSPRGNPGMKDSFTFLSLEVAYKITMKKKEIYGQTARN